MSWLERHEALKAQAEDLARSAQSEVDAQKGATSAPQSVQSLTSRRKLMEMSRVISSIDKLANDNLCAASHLSHQLGSNMQTCLLYTSPSPRD